MAAAPSFRELQQQLIALGERVEDASPLLPELDEDFRQAMRQQFSTGKGWKKISPAYAAQKAREGKPRTTGVYTGGLRDSLATDNRFHVERYTRDKSFIIGSAGYTARTGRPIPVAFLFAGKHRSRNQPRRKLSFPAALRRAWLGKVQDYLVAEST